MVMVMPAFAPASAPACAPTYAPAFAPAFAAACMALARVALASYIAYRLRIRMLGFAFRMWASHFACGLCISHVGFASLWASHFAYGIVDCLLPLMCHVLVTGVALCVVDVEVALGAVGLVP